ncbi:MAG: thioredoxin 1 [Arenicella sp.]|jgi:thioredoxin 1
MKKTFVITLLLAFGQFASAESEPVANLAGEGIEKVFDDNDGGIKFFHGSWLEALTKADKEDKMIFLDAYASWCGPCKIMAKNTFTEAKAGDFFNKNFINYKMDMEKDPNGPRLSRKFNLEAYPSLYFLDKNEKVVHFAIGMHSLKDLLRLGQAALIK